ncbi:MAG TPA: nucleotide sugar dehydrogenase [Terriglobales bacterium]|jgi:UDP-N-acetyl-D-mannosaminuronic acid dehydrogenase|nr:nucleotide sugar dehydrogenase [Terriglobales bacterium]
MTPRCEQPAEICVVGGAGHVGLPLAIVFASKGRRVLIYDRNQSSFDAIRSGQMPFMENGAEPLLDDVLSRGLLALTDDPQQVAGVKSVVITIGTPVDEFLSPSLWVITKCFDDLLPYLSEEQLIVIRSTVYPGVTDTMAKYVRSKGKSLNLAFCPERIVEGHAIEELQTLPQIVSGTTPEAEEAAAELFLLIAPEVVRLAPIEAELLKMFSNAYRYIQFAVANQFYMIATTANVDYYKILEAMKRDYPRSKHFPSAGLTAGPCLFKDTMQLASFYRNQFGLGYQAMLVNEGLPQFIVDQLDAAYPLEQMNIGLLGMAFKAESDDPRFSLSYKLKKILAFRAKAVLTTDPYVQNDADLLPVDDVIRRSDALILCAPHEAYRNLNLHHEVIIDIWNFWGRGSLIKKQSGVLDFTRVG